MPTLVRPSPVPFVAALAQAPRCWLRQLARHAGAAQRRLAQALASPAPDAARRCGEALQALQAAWATAAFDAARDVHATHAVVAAARPSLLASGRFERAVHGLERLALGPWARRV